MQRENGVFRGHAAAKCVDSGGKRFKARFVEKMSETNGWPSTSGTLLGQLQNELSNPHWQTFLSIYEPVLISFCRRKGLQESDARDVTQISLIAVMKGIVGFTYDPVKGKFRSWLGTIVAREIARYRRKQFRAGIQLVDQPAWELRTVSDDDVAWSLFFNREICNIALRRIESDFEDETWRAFELLWKQDVSPGVVAATMNRPVSWAYQAKFRVLKRLEEEVRFLSADIPSLFKSKHS